MENKVYLFLRYTIILSILIGISISISNEFHTLIVILILIFIINNQLRYFVYNNKKYIVFMSIVIEWILAYILYTNYGGILISYFIISIVDVFFLLDKYFLRYIAIIFGFLIFIYSSRFSPSNEMVSSIITIISLILVSSIIQIQNVKNKRTEELYDKLKDSESKLINKNKELKEYSKSLKDLTLLKERNRISREIHDSAGHSLSTIIIQLGAIQKIANVDGKRASEMLSNLIDFSKDGLNDIRNVLKELKPKDFSEYEIIIGIENLVNEFKELTNVDVNINYSKNKYPIKENISLVLYRAVQEFLSNSIKHGKATRINIFLNFEENELIITMKDNGIGIAKLKKGMGLTSLIERVKELNGTVNFESKLNKGFFTRIAFEGVQYEKN